MIGSLVAILLGSTPAANAPAVNPQAEAVGSQPGAPPSALALAAKIRGNTAEAVRLLTIAADQGDEQARFMLAGIYYLGDGVPQDVAKGLVLWRQVAESQDATPFMTGTLSGAAMYRLAVHYEAGPYGKRDQSEAGHWWRRWAKTGDPRAAKVLADRNLRP